MPSLSADLSAKLRCPACQKSLERRDESLICVGCSAAYPVVQGVPIVIDESKSVFRIADCAATAEQPTPEESSGDGSWRDRARSMLRKLSPNPGENLSGEPMLKLLASRLREESPRPKVLVLGGATLGVGMQAIAGDPAFDLAEADVAFGPRTNVILDAHNLPFEDGTFDAVIAQAVFEYMMDPFHVADEMHRVLRPRGWLYSESPFMQQVHGGAYDFFRFTHVGHRRVLRRFEEHQSGVVCGPAMALTWSYRYFLRAFRDNRAYRAATNLFANLTSGWIAPADRWLQHRPGAYDAASAFYFLGTRSETALTDRETLASYRGAWKLRG